MGILSCWSTFQIDKISKSIQKSGKDMINRRRADFFSYKRIGLVNYKILLWNRNAFVLSRRNDIPSGKYSAHLAVHRASWNIQTRVIALISSHYCPWYHPTSVLKFSSKMFSFSIVLVSFPQTMMFLLSYDILLSN